MNDGHGIDYVLPVWHGTRDRWFDLAWLELLALYVTCKAENN
jgi:hypothetical protein